MKTLVSVAIVAGVVLLGWVCLVLYGIAGAEDQKEANRE